MEQHVSYAIVSLSRATSSKAEVFFGSKITSNSYVELKISRAEQIRKSSTNYFFPRRNIITLKLSPNQFSELITNMNTTGIPATITSLDGCLVEQPPYVSEISEFKKEIEEFEPEVYKLVDDLKSFLKEVKLKKSEKERLNSIIRAMENIIKYNIRYVLSTALRSIDKGINEAKSTIDSFYTGLINKIGLNTIEKQKIELIENNIK